MLKDWQKYLNDHAESELWGFIALDYYNHKKKQGNHQDPSHFIDTLLTFYMNAKIDLVSFHGVLLSVCVQLMGHDFAEIIEKSIKLIKNVEKYPDSDQLELIISQYRDYGKQDVFRQRLNSVGLVTDGVSTKVIKEKQVTQVLNIPSEALNLKSLIHELKNVKPGNADAKKYEKIMLTILETLFRPNLTDPHTQVTTVDNREVIDITFQNSAESGFWHDIKNRHGNFVIVFELKNMTDLTNEEFNQISSRLDDKRGRFGVLVSRKNDNLDIQRAYRKLNHHDQVIITITDAEIMEMLELLATGKSPTDYVSKIYRKFMEEA